MKKLRVSVQNKTTLVLEEPGQTGDIIDLSELVTIDQNPIIEAIKRGTDEAYARYFAQQKRQLDAQYEAALYKTKQETVNQLNSDFINRKEQLELKIQKLERDLAAINAAQTSLIESEKQRIFSEKQKEIFDKEQRIAALEQTIVAIEEKKRLELDNQKKSQLLDLNKLEMDYRDQIIKLETEKDQLTRERNLRNVKKIGENLEKWCLEKYLEINAFAFVTSTFEKDNEAIRDDQAIKGTKGDYIFKVYSDRNRSLLLTSAMCEMKSEALESDNKKRNADHYAKLDRDRIKKGLEYAILISELEYTTESDAPIFRVPEYEKMFVVRPSYFITLLGIIESIGMKYADLLNARQLEKMTFKESEQILADFETFKDTILNNSLRYIANQLEEIKKKAHDIIANGNAILNAVNVIVDTHLETVRNKINGFNIKAVTKRIDTVK